MHMRFKGFERADRNTVISSNVRFAPANPLSNLHDDSGACASGGVPGRAAKNRKLRRCGGCRMRRETKEPKRWW